MFLTIFLTVWTVMHIYVFWRMSSIPFISQHIHPIFLVLAAIVLWSSFLLPRFFGNPAAGGLSWFLEMVGSNWLGILFLLFFCLLVIDLITGFGFLMPNLAPRLRGLALLAGIVMSIIGFIQGMRPPVINDYEIELAYLPADADGLVVVDVSDLHIGTLLGEKWLAARVAQIDALHPDLIVMVGDLVEGDDPSERRQSLTAIMHRLAAPLGVWAVTGNHEGHGGLDASVRFLTDGGIDVLRNQWREVRPGLIVAGIDDRGYVGGVKTVSDRIHRALEGRPPNTATIFLSHRPQMAAEAAQLGAGLMLCGHTHGGQIWPFSYISGMANDMLVGEYHVDGMPVIVSRGAGTWGPRMRLWSPGEIVRITLRAPRNK